MKVASFISLCQKHENWFKVALKNITSKNTIAIRDIGLHLKKVTALHGKERKQLFFCASEHTNKILKYLSKYDLTSFM